MKKYIISSEQKNSLNQIIKKLSKNSRDKEKIKQIKETVKKRYTKSQKIGGNTYTKTELQLLSLKRDLTTEIFGFTEKIKGDKNINLRSFNSIKEIHELKKEEEEEKKEEINKRRNKIKVIEERINEEIEKISTKIYESYLTAYKKAKSQKKNTKNKIELLKAMEEIKKNIMKETKEIFPDKNTHRYEEKIEDIKERIFNELEEKGLLEISFEERIENENIDSIRKEAFDMTSEDMQEIRYNQEWLYNSEHLSASHIRKIKKEIKELREKVNKAKYGSADEKLVNMFKNEIRKKELILENNAEELKVSSEKIKLKGMKPLKAIVYLNEVDMYEPDFDRRNKIFRIQKEGIKDFEIIWENQDNWEYIPKGFDLCIKEKIKINAVMYSKLIKSKIKEKIKTSMSIRNKIKEISELKKQIENIKNGKKGIKTKRINNERK